MVDKRPERALVPCSSPQRLGSLWIGCSDMDLDNGLDPSFLSFVFLWASLYSGLHSMVFLVLILSGARCSRSPFKLPILACSEYRQSLLSILYGYNLPVVFIGAIVY